MATPTYLPLELYAGPGNQPGDVRAVTVAVRRRRRDPAVREVVERRDRGGHIGCGFDAGIDDRHADVVPMSTSCTPSVLRSAWESKAARMLLTVDVRLPVSALVVAVTPLVTPLGSWVAPTGASSEMPSTLESSASSARALGESSATVPRRCFLRNRPPRFVRSFRTLSLLSERWRMITRVLLESVAWFRRARSSLLRFSAVPGCDVEGDPEPEASLPNAATGKTAASDITRHASRTTFMMRSNMANGQPSDFRHIRSMHAAMVLVCRRADDNAPSEPAHDCSRVCPILRRTWMQRRAMLSMSAARPSMTGTRPVAEASARRLWQSVARFCVVFQNAGTLPSPSTAGLGRQRYVVPTPRRPRFNGTGLTLGWA